MDSLGATGTDFGLAPTFSIFEPGSPTDHSLVLKVQNPCTSPGEEISLTNVGVDIAGMS